MTRLGGEYLVLPISAANREKCQNSWDFRPARCDTTHDLTTDKSSTLGGQCAAGAGIIGGLASNYGITGSERLAHQSRRLGYWFSDLYPYFDLTGRFHADRILQALRLECCTEPKNQICPGDEG
jgi:hypothetical protein